MRRRVALSHSVILVFVFFFFADCPHSLSFLSQVISTSITVDHMKFSQLP